jgi:hypothetical protein
MKSAQEFQNVSLQLVKKPTSGDPRRQVYLEFVMGYDVSASATFDYVNVTIINLYLL